MRVTGEPERIHPVQEGPQLTMEERMRDLTTRVDSLDAPVFHTSDAWSRLLGVEHHARALHALLTGSPRHTRDSAPVQEAVKALGMALGVEP
jgi:hypothetical protein